MAEELKGPSFFEIKKYIQDEVWVEFFTLNDKILKGKIKWYDGESFHLGLENGQELTLMKQSIVYYNVV